MDISNLLNDIMHRKAQKLHGQNNLNLNEMMGQGLPNISQSLNAGDFLQSQPQNAILRSLSRTPVQLPSVSFAQQPMQNAFRHDQAVSLQPKSPKEKVSEKKQLQIDKETFPFYKKIKDQHGSTAEVDARLDEMEELLNTGNVQQGSFIKGFEALSHVPYVGPFAGAIQQAFLSHESQVFKKLSTDFLRDAKPYFGNNLSTREVELFLERVPSLMLTNEGNKAVIRNFRALNDYLKSQDKIMEGVIAENGGERPRHLESKVQERLKPAANQLRKAFRDSVKLIPKKEVKKFKIDKKSLPQTQRPFKFQKPI